MCQPGNGSISGIDGDLCPESSPETAQIDRKSAEEPTIPRGAKLENGEEKGASALQSTSTTLAGSPGTPDLATHLSSGTADSGLPAILDAGTVPVPSPHRDHIPIAAIILVLVVSLIGITLLIAFVPEESYTEFYVLNGENRSVVNLSPLSPDDSIPLWIGVGNREHRPTRYVVEIYRANVSYDIEERSTAIGGLRRLDFFQLDVPEGRNIEVPYTLKPSNPPGNSLILVLFNENVPACTIQGVSRLNQSYRYLFLTFEGKNAVRPPLNGTPSRPPVVFIEMANVTGAGERDPDISWSCGG